MTRRAVSFINPLEVDGFSKPGGWGSHADPLRLPLLVFLPGMDGSLADAVHASTRRCAMRTPTVQPLPSH